MNKEIVVMRGIPGSGKTTYVRRELKDHLVFSSDNFHIDPVSRLYVFKPEKLAEGHAWCLRLYTEHLIKRTDDPVVVDNTGTSVAEVAPYAALAQAYGANLRIITVRTPVDLNICIQRNIHGVSGDRINIMASALQAETLRLPKWWPHEYVGPFDGS